MECKFRVPFYVVKDSLGASAGRGKALFHYLRRPVVCVLAVAVLLAGAGGVAYAAEGDPPDLDPAGFATPGQVDDPRMYDSDYGVIPFSQSSPNYWTTTEINSVVNMANNLMLGNGTRSIVTMNLHLQGIESSLSKLESRFSSNYLQSILDYLSSDGVIASRILFISNQITAFQNSFSSFSSSCLSHLSNLYIRLGQTNTKLDVVNSNLDTVNRNFVTVISHLRSDYYHFLGDESFVLRYPTYQRVAVFRNFSLISYLTGVSSDGYYEAVSADFDLIQFETFVNSDLSSSDVPILMADVPYMVSLSFPGSYTHVPDSVYLNFLGYGLNAESFTFDSILGNVTVSAYFIPVKSISLDYFAFRFSGSSLQMSTSGTVRCSFVRAPDLLVQDLQASDAVNPGQSAVTDQLQQGAAQLEAFDQKTFEDVTKYTAQLNFGLGDWAEAASGISYIGSVFMLIWDNSPTQPIILSLMLGLCMLVLGRGARIAAAASSGKSEERSDRRVGK